MGDLGSTTLILPTNSRGHHYVVAPVFFVESTVLSTSPR